MIQCTVPWDGLFMKPTPHICEKNSRHDVHEVQLIIVVKT